jgi:hypothetical protein
MTFFSVCVEYIELKLNDLNSFSHLSRVYRIEPKELEFFLALLRRVYRTETKGVEFLAVLS